MRRMVAGHDRRLCASVRVWGFWRPLLGALRGSVHRARGTMKRAVLLAVLALAMPTAAVATGSAGISGASNGLASVARTIWYNTPYNVAETIYLHWNTSDGVGFSSVYCRGEVRHLWIYRHGKYWYHRLSCNGWDYWNRHVGLQVWVTGPSSLHVIQTWCHDSYSSYSCPYYGRRQPA